MVLVQIIFFFSQFKEWLFFKWCEKSILEHVKSKYACLLINDLHK